MLQPEKLQAMPMVKRANTHGRPCEILEGFWKDDPVGRRVPGPIRAFPLSVFSYCIVFDPYITTHSGNLSTAERSSHTDVFLTIPLTEAQFSTFITLVPWCGVSSVV